MVDGSENPVNSAVVAVEVGKSPQSLQGFYLGHPRWCFAGFLNHQQVIKLYTLYTECIYWVKITLFKGLQHGGGGGRPKQVVWDF